MPLRLLIKFVIAGTISLQCSASWANENSSVTFEDTLPKLYAFSAPLSQTQVDFFMDPLLEFLRSECKRPVPTEIKADQLEACTLEESWFHLKGLLHTLHDSEASPLHFSGALSNPHLDQVAAGAWRKNIMAAPPAGQPAEPNKFSAEIMLTKIIIQKALLASARWSVFISRDADNTAQNYIIPKLIQSLEGRSLLGGLFERYKSQKCPVTPNSTSPNSTICQIEKNRLATIINTLYKSNREEIEKVLKVASQITNETSQDSAKQLAFIEPLQKTLREILHSAVPADKLWLDLKTGKSNERDRIAKNFIDLTTTPISLRNSDLVNTYIFLSALLTIKHISDIIPELEKSQQSITELIPQILESSDLKKINNISRKELSIMTSVIQDFFTQSAEGDF